MSALDDGGYEVSIIQDGSTFCRVVVAMEEDAVLVDLAQMMGPLGRFRDDEIPLPPSDLPSAKEFFRVWAEELN